jgi:hypothetical protein
MKFQFDATSTSISINSAPPSVSSNLTVLFGLPVYVTPSSHEETVISLIGELDDKFYLRKILSIEQQSNEDGILLSDDVFFVFGEGLTLDEALNDYKITIIEYYEYLSTCDDPETKDLFAYLNTYLARI